MKVTLVDVGLGNLHSVERALRAAGADDVAIVSDANVVRRADAIVFPGQGAFRDCAKALERGGMGDAIAERIHAGIPYLGICLGMQVLFSSSDEAPGAAGLGIFEGHVRKIEPKGEHKVPHTGWNTIERAKACILPESAWFYFVHSFVAAPSEASLIAATTTHGTDRFASAVAKDNVLAVQFHPEKSQRAGIELLERWIAAF